MVTEAPLTYEQLNDRVIELETLFDVLRSNQADAIIGDGDVAFIRLRHVEEALRQSEVRFRLLMENVQDYAIFILDPQGCVASWNAGSERVMGWSTDEVIGQHFSVFSIPEDRAKGIPAQDLQRCITTGRCFLERMRQRKDGSQFWAEISMTALHDENGELRGFAKVTRDISERKRAEERIQASLAEKEVLLKEVHHRVKNNLQIVSSLVSLQADELRDQPNMRNVCEDIRDRVRSMALIHEKLYQSASLTCVDFGGYTQELMRSLWRTHRAELKHIRLNTELQPVHLVLERAIPCGLLLNELVTNALKHAFQGRDGGEVKISLSLTPCNFATAPEITAVSDFHSPIPSQKMTNNGNTPLAIEFPTGKDKSTSPQTLPDPKSPTDTHHPDGAAHNDGVPVTDERNARDETADSPLVTDTVVHRAKLQHSDQFPVLDSPLGRAASADSRFPAASQICLTVCDNGIGLPAGLDWRKASTLGLKLVRMLAQQLNGTVDVHCGAGTAYQITFPHGKK